MAEKKRKTKGAPDLIDKHVGKQLRRRRILIGLSQEKLAESIGVTFQQVQKYERGTNRISASRLYNFSKTLEVSINYFYEGLLGDKAIVKGMADNAQEGFGGTTGTHKKLGEDTLNKKETMDLIRAYYSIADEKKRKDILQMVKTMAKNLS